MSISPIVSAGIIGVCAGAAEFIWHTAVQKIGMVVAKLEFKQRMDPEDGSPLLPGEALDKQFVPMVVQAPMIEEMIFRGLLQPAISYGIASCFPQLVTPALLGISKASLLPQWEPLLALFLGSFGKNLACSHP